MKRWEFCRLASGSAPFRILGIVLVSLGSAQGQRFEVTPLVGGILGGTWRLEQQGVPNFNAHLGSGLSFGIAGGVRFDGDDIDYCKECNSIQFRWIRQNTHLGINLDPVVLSPVSSSFHPAVTIDHFLGDFSHEWAVQESKKVNPFLTVSLGAARTATPAATAVRFVFGIGGGVKVFPSRHWGFRFQAEYLPIVMQAELQRVVCVVGCIVALDGGILNQFQFSAGPAFRF
jgi:hypothetical protein